MRSIRSRRHCVASPCSTASRWRDRSRRRSVRSRRRPNQARVRVLAEIHRRRRVGRRPSHAIPQVGVVIHAAGLARYRDQRFVGGDRHGARCLPAIARRHFVFDIGRTLLHVAAELREHRVDERALLGGRQVRDGRCRRDGGRSAGAAGTDDAGRVPGRSRAVTVPTRPCVSSINSSAAFNPVNGVRAVCADAGSPKLSSCALRDAASHAATVAGSLVRIRNRCASSSSGLPPNMPLSRHCIERAAIHACSAQVQRRRRVEVERGLSIGPASRVTRRMRRARASSISSAWLSAMQRLPLSQTTDQF